MKWKTTFTRIGALRYNRPCFTGLLPLNTVALCGNEEAQAQIFHDSYDLMIFMAHMVILEL